MSEFDIVIHGEKSTDARAVSEVLIAADRLFRAVAKETVGHEIGLQIVAFGYRCDGCGRKVKKLPKTWVKRGADDLCRRCASNQESRPE